MSFKTSRNWDQRLKELFILFLPLGHLSYTLVLNNFREMNMKKNLLVLGFILLTSFSVYAEGTREAVAPIGSPSFSRKVLIATEATQFKDALVKKLVELLTDGKTYIQVIDHSGDGLIGVDPRQYGAVLVINSGAQAQVRPWVLSWLKSIAAYDANVILLTTQITVWNPPVKVDSVTSASSMPDLDKIAGGLVARVNKLL